MLFSSAFIYNLRSYLCEYTALCEVSKKKRETQNDGDKTMTTVYFVRHAEPNYNNHNDALRELSPKGTKDRKLVTDFLSDKEIDIVLSSPYKRAVDTIKDFADLNGLDIETIDSFRERKVDSGWIDNFTSFAQKQWNDFSYKLSDGECLQEVQDKNVSAL